jgi:hypothetical protein
MAGGLVGAASAVSTVGAAVDAFRPPLTGAATWTEVMTAAGWRCACAGDCGRPHPKSGDRCTSERRRGQQLTVAPIDPLTPTAAAATAPLMAWCAGCFDLARRAAQKTADTPATTDQLDLFGGDAA